MKCARCGNDILDGDAAWERVPDGEYETWVGQYDHVHHTPTYYNRWVVPHRHKDSTTCLASSLLKDNTVPRKRKK